MKKGLLFCLSLVALMTLSSCQKDLADKIEGEWLLTTLKVDNLDILALTQSYVMKFDDNSDGKGVLTQIITATNGSVSNTTGTYDVNEADSQITLTGNGDTITYLLSIDGDAMKMTNLPSDSDVTLIEGTRQ